MKTTAIILLLFAFACKKKEIDPALTRDPDLPVYIEYALAGDSGLNINIRITQKKDSIVTFFSEFNYNLEKDYKHNVQYLKVDGLIVSENDNENRPFIFQEDRTLTIYEGFNKVSSKTYYKRTEGKYIVSRNDTCYLVVPILR